MMNYGNGNWRMHDHAGAGVGGLMVLLMLVFPLAVVVAIVAFLRGTTTPTAVPVLDGHLDGHRASDARAILRERFARGDIDEQDFRARMRALDDTVT